MRVLCAPKFGALMRDTLRPDALPGSPVVPRGCTRNLCSLAHRAASSLHSQPARLSLLLLVRCWFCGLARLRAGAWLICFFCLALGCSHRLSASCGFRYSSFHLSSVPMLRNVPQLPTPWQAHFVLVFCSGSSWFYCAMCCAGSALHYSGQTGCILLRLLPCECIHSRVILNFHLIEQ